MDRLTSGMNLLRVFSAVNDSLQSPRVEILYVLSENDGGLTKQQLVEKLREKKKKQSLTQLQNASNFLETENVINQVNSVYHLNYETIQDFKQILNYFEEHREIRFDPV